MEIHAARSAEIRNGGNFKRGVERAQFSGIRQGNGRRLWIMLAADEALERLFDRRRRYLSSRPMQSQDLGSPGEMLWRIAFIAANMSFGMADDRTVGRRNR